MDPKIIRLQKVRSHLLDLTASLTSDEYNHVPPGFNNNIIWNMAHLITAQQNLCYGQTGQQWAVDKAYFAAFKPDTKPERYIPQEEITNIKKLLLSTMDRLETDYQNGLFTSYSPRTTRYGADLANIDDALYFLPFHEGWHTGYIMSLKKVLKY